MSTQIEEIKKDMVATAEKVNFWIKAIFYSLLFFLVIGILFFWRGVWVPTIVFLGIPAVFFLFAFFGFMIVRPEERIMIEFLGKPYGIKKPGLRWRCPFLMKERKKVFTWERPIKLFPNGVHIDFKYGGKAELVDPILWVRLIGAGTAQEEENILKTIYGVEECDVAIRESAETALRTHLNNLTVDETLTAIFKPQKASWWEELKESFPGLGETIQGYGQEPKRLTISDFNWDKSVVATRQKIFEEERSIALADLSVKAAANEVKQKAMESGGLHREIVKILTEEHGYNSEEAIKIATTLVLYYKGTETGSLIDVRGGDLAPLIAAVVAMLRGLPYQGKPAPGQDSLGKPKKKEEKPEKKEKVPVRKEKTDEDYLKDLVEMEKEQKEHKTGRKGSEKSEEEEEE